MPRGMVKTLGLSIALCGMTYLALLFGVWFVTKRAALAIFPELSISRVLKWTARHSGPYGCTFMVIELREAQTAAPPPVVIPERGYKSNFAKNGMWRPTPVPQDVVLDRRADCLTGAPDKAEGAGLDGYGAQVADILTKSGAWFSVYGGGEHQVLLVYAPQERLAIRLRFGD